MTIVAHYYPLVAGVDTHARTHTVALIDTTTGQVMLNRTFPTTPGGLKRLTGWISHQAGTHKILTVIEGIGSYGAKLADLCNSEGLETVEPGPMGKHDYRGKNDQVDAARIARSVTGMCVERLRRPRSSDGARAALRVLITARDEINRERTAAINALTALLRIVDLGVDARKSLTKTVIVQITRWREHDEPIHLAIARREAVRLAHRVNTCNQELADNKQQITTIVKQTDAAKLLNLHGVGPLTAAQIWISFSHQGRIRTEACFAALAGVNPIPASSGNTQRHRLNRGGDRRLNQALHTIILVRTRSHLETKTYITKRLTQGKTQRETRRCLKRYLARQIYRTLTNTTPTQPTT
jgi:transposase